MDELELTRRDEEIESANNADGETGLTRRNEEMDWVNHAGGGPATLREILDRAASEADWVEIIQALVRDAKRGGAIGARAAEVLCRYRWGTLTRETGSEREPAPIEIIEIDVRPREMESGGNATFRKRRRPHVGGALARGTEGGVRE